MIDYAVIGAIAGPALLLLLLRGNAVLAFLSLGLGSVLAQIAAPDVTQVVGSVAPGGQVVGLNTMALSLLLVPALLTIVLTMRTVRPSQLLLQIVPAFGLGALGLILARPYLSPIWQQKLVQTSIWPTLDALQVVIVGLCAFVCLLVIWTQRPKHSFGKHDSH